MELFEESGDHKGVTEVQKEATEHQALVLQVGGVWSRVDVAYRNLRQQQHIPVHQVYLNQANEEDEYILLQNKERKKERNQSEALRSSNRCT